MSKKNSLLKFCYIINLCLGMIIIVDKFNNYGNFAKLWGLVCLIFGIWGIYSD